MKRIVTILVAALMVLGMFSSLMTVSAKAGDPTGNQNLTFIANRWHRISTDKYGDPLSGSRSFPWQKEGESYLAYWGRTDYGMPNALLAVSTDGTARATRQNNTGSTVQPMLWTEIWLTYIANDGKSRPIVDDGGDFIGLGKWYVVMDTAGQVWFDPDGHFNDSRYLRTADPASPSYTFVTVNGVAYGAALTNPLGKVDPSEANNTQGPYAFTPTDAQGNENPYYVEPCYFWVRPQITKIVSSINGANLCDAYANHTLKGQSRAWQLGIASQPDYLARGKTSPLGNVSDGLVRPGEWDGPSDEGTGLTVIPFNADERWADNVLHTSDVAGAHFDPGDYIYRKLTPPPAYLPQNINRVQPNDVRLTNVIIGVPPNHIMYFAGTVVQVGDADCQRVAPLIPAPGLPLYAFPPNVVYAIKGSSAATELNRRMQAGNIGVNGWANLSPMGTTVLAVKDVSKFTVGSTIRVVSKDTGLYEMARVVQVINTNKSTWRYGYQWWGWPPGYYFYNWDMNGTFNIGDYVWCDNEMQRITNINYNFPWNWGWMYTHTVYFASNFIYWKWWIQTMSKVDKALVLDRVLANTYEVDDTVQVVGYKPGDFIYRKDQSCTTVSVFASAGGSQVTVADSSIFLVGQKITIQGDNAGEDETFIITNIVGNDITVSGTLQFNHSVGRTVCSDSASVNVNDVRLSDVDQHMINGQVIGQGAWENDLLLMSEVVFADPNDPRYQGSVRNSDWHKNTGGASDAGSTVASDTAYANCMPVFDLTVSCDLWQGERVWSWDAQNSQWISSWKGVTPSVTAIALRSPNKDVAPAHNRVAKSTVLDPTGAEFFVHAVTIHNVTPDYREYLGLEIFCDNGFDNLIPRDAGISLDLFDNYVRGTTCEAYVGATDRGVDLDYGRPFTAKISDTLSFETSFANDVKNTPMYIDIDGNGEYGCGEPIYFDLDKNGRVSIGDKRCFPIAIEAGPAVPSNGQIVYYLPGTIVSQGDTDCSPTIPPWRILTAFRPNVKWYDSLHPISRLPSGVYEYGENIYQEAPSVNNPNGNGFVDAGDIRLSQVDIGPVTYYCGDPVGIGDIFENQIPIMMMGLGRNGDYNYIDMEVLPFPTMDVEVTMDKSLKVEQTSHISVKVNPPPKPGESIFVALRETTLNARMPIAERMVYDTQTTTEDLWLEPNVVYACAGTRQGVGQNSNNFVNLPFNFSFYGVGYTSVNIGVAGWIAMNTYQWNAVINPNWNYNWYLPWAYGQLPYKLATANTPPRIHVLAYWWNAQRVCWGNAVWPKTGEPVFVCTWEGRDGYPYGTTWSPPNPPDRWRCQVILFASGEILTLYKRTDCPLYFYPTWQGYTDFDMGITSGDGVNYTSTVSQLGPCGFTNIGVRFIPTVIPGRAGIPQIKMAEDLKFISQDNLTANFEFTPYRGTCLQDGSRSPVEINLYRDVGGYKEPAPRNPPPSTYMTYREPSFIGGMPLTSGRIIAVDSVFGYLGDADVGQGKGDWILIGTRENVERRRITQRHIGSNDATSFVRYHVWPSNSTVLSKIVPSTKDVSKFNPGDVVVIGPTTSTTQETNLVVAAQNAPSPINTTRITANAARGNNVTISVQSGAGFAAGQYIGYGQNNWWNSVSPANNHDMDTAKIISVAGNAITVDAIHATNGWQQNWYIAQTNAVEVRDPIKFAHHGAGDAGGANGEPLFTTRFGFTINRGLNYDHIFGDPVVGILYFDPYWCDNKWSRFDLDMYPNRSFSGILSADGISPDLDNKYDCYWRGRFNVEPEDIDIISYRKCLQVLDQRYPNVIVKLMDHDNPNDVNDPGDIPISCPWGQNSASPEQTIIANVNASGCGVKYLMTVDGFGSNQNPPSDIDFVNNKSHRFIVQVNVDGTYEWWRWYEPAASSQIIGVLDPNDFLYRWLDDDPDNVQPNTNQPYPAGTNIRTFYPQWDNAYENKLTDNDLSIGGGVCDPCNKDTMWPCLGDVTYKDGYGRFNGAVTDWAANYPNTSNPPTFTYYYYGKIANFGVPTAIERWTTTSDGGEIMIPVHPREPGKLTIRAYTYQTVFDYNSFNIHKPGPYFVEDTSFGIDYCGYITLDVQPADADLNFIEMRMVDHSLQRSKLNYTAGTNPLYPMQPPAPRIKSWYDPIVRNWKTDVRAYPGGQTHPGRLTGDTKGEGRNAYPAIWKKQFNKLGTEFYPLSDYGLYFILADGTGNHIGVGSNANPPPAGYKNLAQEPNLSINFIKLTGPFMTPKYWDTNTNRSILGGMTNPYYMYNNVKGLPIAYDYSGEIEVNNYNHALYYSPFGRDYSNIINPLSADPVAIAQGDRNEWLSKWNDLWYGMSVDKVPGFYCFTNTTFPNLTNYSKVAPGVTSPNPVDDQPTAVWVFDELIPVGAGNINIEVQLQNGVSKVFEDCCESAVSGRLRNIPVHGLRIENLPKSVIVDKDNTIEVKLVEDTAYGTLDNGEWSYKECNDALVIVWQDKGVVDSSTKLIKGALDGWIAMPPTSSEVTDLITPYKAAADVNNDGFITYKDDETEIVGSYDMATNTWTGGFIDARTFQRQEGLYKFELTNANKSQIKTVGVDVGGKDELGRPLPRNITDHIIDETELAPIIVTAYKYGDDNQDRAFTPLYDQVTNKDFSHEAYLAGQAKIDIDTSRDWNVTYGPEPLTAGVVSELIDAPLTLTITDYDGKPVDLSKGIPDAGGQNTVIDRNIWYNLIKDPHPDNEFFYGKGAILPQYYWLRTDLHNIEDKPGEGISNTNLWSPSWYPIQFGSDLTNGKYSFKGFIANDKGEFEIYVYSPDRKHSGVTKVKVVQPKVKYEILNMQKPENVFTTPGDPDFIMTAADNRIYKITVTCSNAQDALLKGVSRTVSVCSGSSRDIARFTPAITIPASYYSFNNSPVYLGVDLNGDNKLTQLTLTQTEYTSFGTISGLYYNTFNTKYTNGLYEIQYSIGLGNWYPNMQGYLFPIPLQNGWPTFPTVPKMFGICSIYNSMYDGTYLFSDLTPDGQLTFRDALSLDDNGRTTFFIYATDAFDITGLIGYNSYTNLTQYADVGMNPNAWVGRATYPNYTNRRFRAGYIDGTFKLDWEAWGDTKAKIRMPKVTILDPETKEEWKKSLLNPDAYDLTYGIRNHILVRVFPADSRDLPVREHAGIEYATSDRAGQVFNGRTENMPMGRLIAGKDDPNTRETNLFIEPTGTGDLYAGLQFEELYDGSLGTMGIPWWQQIVPVALFDAVKGMEIIPEIPDAIKVGKETKLNIKVVVAGGTNEPVEGVKVAVSGVVTEQNATTNTKGEVQFTINPSDVGKIIVKATSEKFGTAIKVIGCEIEATAPYLIVNPLPSFTNQQQAKIVGETNPGNTVKIAGKPAKIDKDGKFTFNVDLNEGFNQFDVDAISPAGLTTTVTMSITRDTIAPEIVCDQEKPVEVTAVNGNVILTGRVEPYSQVTVNGVKADVVFDVWMASVPVTNSGTVKITLDVKDPAGNSNTKTFEIIVVAKDILVITVDSSNVEMNGQPTVALPRAPKNNNGVYMVPLEVFSTIFGSTAPAYDAATDSTTATGLNGKDLVVKNKSKMVTYGTEQFTLGVDAMNDANIMFVEVAGMAKLLGLDCNVNPATNTITLTRVRK